MPRYHKGDRFRLSENALDNYGEQYRGIIYTIEQSCLYSSDFETDLYDWEMEILL